MLVDGFQAREEHYTSKQFNETALRTEFIDPFFDALGWDVSNERKVFLYLQDTIPETRLKTGKSVKYADYGMRIDGRAVFYVEAEAANRPLYAKKNVHQAKRYAWSSTRAALAVLTNFKELCVYDARKKPIFEAPEAGKLDQYCMEYTEYEAKWPQLWALFEKQNVANGSVEHLLAQHNPALERENVNEAFLKDLDRYRLELARSLYAANPQISETGLNQAVHHILNQIVFARILEDRDIEPTGRLREAVMMWQDRKRSETLLHKFLQSEFQRMEKRYQGVIFAPHFSDDLIVPDDVLAAIVQSLYPPISPYTFDIIPVEVLGRAYEQYLGKIIEINNGQVELLLKPEVRKAGGVFYTPEFVVDFILDRTLDEKIKDKKPYELDQVKTLDPACGAGAFTVSAAKRILARARAGYAANPQDIDRKDTEFPDAYQTDDGSYKLSVKRKAELIENTIFCTDIDPQAIEISRMWLYILMLQGEGSAVVTQERTYKVPNRQWPRYVETFKLPDLDQNVINGNALVGKDFSDDAYERNRVRAFDWDKGNLRIHDVVRKGGFDVIIGNPPYISLLDAKKYFPKQSDYLKDQFKSMSYGRPDLSFAFIEQGINLLKPQGLLGNITTNSFVWNESGRPLRQIISDNNYMHTLIDLGVTKIFHDAGPSTAIVILQKANNKEFVHARVDDPGNKLMRQLQTAIPDMEYQTLPTAHLHRADWAFPKAEDLKLFEAMDGQKLRIADIGDAFTGITTGADKIFLLEKTDSGSFFQKQLKNIIS